MTFQLLNWKLLVWIAQSKSMDTIYRLVTQTLEDFNNHKLNYIDTIYLAKINEIEDVAKFLENHYKAINIESVMYENTDIRFSHFKVLCQPYHIFKYEVGDKGEQYVSHYIETSFFNDLNDIKS